MAWWGGTEDFPDGGGQASLKPNSSEKNLDQNNFGSKKFYSKTILKDKKVGIQNTGQKEIVGLKMFWPQKNSSLNKFFVQKYLESKQLGVQKNIGEKKFEHKKYWLK